MSMLSENDALYGVYARTQPSIVLVEEEFHHNDVAKTAPLPVATSARGMYSRGL